MASEPQVVEHFFGVYLLYCKNPKYKGRTYIGYTVDPKRRIKQHNAGKNFGGAWKTSNRGPWEMVLIVHGFPNATSALRFEWAWQHPDLSRRLRHIPKKKARQKKFDYCLMILTEMLQVGPWCRLPLTLRWLDDEFADNYRSLVTPPLHMPITCGKVISKKPKSINVDVNVIETPNEDCLICSESVDFEDRLGCVNSTCTLIVHLICLAEQFKTDNKILPIEGICPVCDSTLLWGDLVRKKIGCNMNIDDSENEDDCLSDE